ncbi:S28 family serine protease [Amycolatopsis minnesotensis]|uniref:S28 family serine protease n=1 Tax=Amycolatopsis minnesotensis TaxID=337894 RepID=A0ABP5BRT3_9PSEU
MHSWFKKGLTAAVAMLAITGLAQPVASAAPGGAPEDITVALKKIPGLKIVSEDPAPTGYRFFKLTYTQPADYTNPKAGTFEQRLTLLHRDVTAPTVMFTSGYNVSESPNRSEPTQIVNGNQVSMEYRYFTPSIPAKTDWHKQLTIWQAAVDEHRIVQAFKSVYHANWLATGGSKGGMTATYFRRFFPNDVNGTIPYVAPNDVVNEHDSYNKFLSKVGDPGCRDAVKAVQRDALKRRDELGGLVKQVSDQKGYTYNVVGSLDKAIELIITDTYFTFWQYQPPTECANVPKPGAPAKDLYAWFEKVDSLTGYADQEGASTIAYNYQASYQLGWYETYDAHLRDLLRYPGTFVPWTFLPKEVKRPKFDHFAMPDIDFWVRTQAKDMLYVYGEYDPWGAERFAPARFPWSDNHVYTVPKGNHGAKIAQLPADQAAAATATVRKWAGLPEQAPDARTFSAPSAPAGFPQFDADLMMIDRPKF